MALLEVRDLSIDIAGIKPLDGIGFSVDKGQILGLVGESGSGKSLTALTIMGLLPLIGGRVESGSIRFDGTELTTLPEPQMRHLRGRRIAFITQNPMTSLDPVMRVGAQIDQVARLHLGLDAKAAAARSVALMERLRIPAAATVYHHYPHQLSGGMKQRIVIAMALAADPDLIVADEPTTALDVTIQAQIVQLLVELVRDRGVALILITHDMGVVAQACDRVVVLYAGRVAESNDVQAIFATPRHPYTQALIRCIPREGMAPGSLTGIPGAVPGVASYPSGCRFHPRCPLCAPRCLEIVPPLDQLPSGAEIACHAAEMAEVAFG
ncbi:MAG TPA: ABC transporter ATP-binding protein [Dongiaceae bacterium]|nr:ABC transporter ATP-binding protein [Dongiaceae bacterium]